MTFYKISLSSISKNLDSFSLLVVDQLKAKSSSFVVSPMVGLNTNNKNIFIPFHTIG
jgi:hypothetical protein